jgi:hypothetical protein
MQLGGTLLAQYRATAVAVADDLMMKGTNRVSASEHFSMITTCNVEVEEVEGVPGRP